MRRLERDKQLVLLIGLVIGLAGFAMLLATGAAATPIAIVIALAVTATLVIWRLVMPQSRGTSISETTITIEFPIDRARDLFRSALESVHSAHVTNESGPLTVAATTSLSTKSFGEVITITGTVLSDQPDAVVPVRCQITSELLDSRALVDYGKKRDNVEKVAAVLLNRSALIA